MYIIYNNDGSIKRINLTDYIQKGNDNVNSIFFAIEGKPNTEWAGTLYCTLPNDEVEGPITLNYDTQTINGVEYSGYVWDVLADVTIYEGIVKFSLQATTLGTTNTLFTYQGQLVINPSSIVPNETKITVAQYEYLRDTVLELNSDIVSLGQNLGQNYVPYSGADDNVDLGNHNLNVASITLYSDQAQILADELGLTITSTSRLYFYASNYSYKLSKENAWEEIATQDWVNDGFVPYTGATGDVNLGNNNLKFGTDYGIGLGINGLHIDASNDGAVFIDLGDSDLFIGDDDEGHFTRIQSQKNLLLQAGSGYKVIFGSDITFSSDVNLGNHSLTLKELFITTSNFGLDIRNGDLYISTGTGNICLNPDEKAYYNNKEIATVDDISTALGTVEEELDALDIGGGI